MRVNAIYGNILFPDDETAIVQLVQKTEFVEGETLEDCEEMAEYNASFYGGDWLIPEKFNGKITYEVTA